MSAKKMSESKIVKMKGRRYAVGLSWGVPTTEETAANEARRLARADDIDLYVVCNTDEPQYAFARKKDGAQVGAIAAAAVARELMHGSWCAAVEIPEGWWIISIRQNYIDAEDGDLFFTDEEEARVHFQRILDQGEWGNVFAPSSWGFEDINSLQVDEILSATSKKYRLTEVNPLAGRMKSILVLSAALLIVGGGAIWFSQIDSANETNELRNDLQNELQNISKPKPVRIAPGWYAKPTAEQAIKACLDNISSFDVIAPGWDVEQIICEDNIVSASWIRQTGTASWLQKWADAHHPDKTLQFGEFHETALMSYSLPELKPRGKEAVMKAGEVWRVLSDARQVTGNDVRLGTPQEPRLPDAVKSAVIERPHFKVMSFSLNTSFPSAWTPFLKKLPGLTLEGISFDPRNGFYQITGDIYVQR